jgi:hypothetical protein
MPTPLIPQEVYLLERYSSAVYFNTMADAWASMVAVAEKALAQFMTQLPSDYRRRHLSMQPDIVWGERVLPNFRKTLEALESGRLRVAARDLSALGYAHSVTNDARGQSLDYPPEWMGAELEKLFWDWQDIARCYAANIAISERCGWNQFSLGALYDEVRGPLNPPESWPIYRLNPAVKIKTDDIVKQNGIYLPDADDSCAGLLIEGYEAFDAEIGYDPATMQPFRREPTTWTLIERIADSGGGTPVDLTAPAAQPILRIRVQAGQSCPEAGYYFTPAQENSRRYFEVGTLMPSVGGDYGMTIWQWDLQQA